MTAIRCANSRPTAYYLSLALAFFAWEVLTRSLVAYLANTSPEVAYWLRATPTVLLNLADDKLNADAATKVVEPVLSYDFEHAKQERSYAKGIQSIEKLDAPANAASNSDATSASSNESGADNLSRRRLPPDRYLGEAGLQRRIPSTRAPCASWVSSPNISQMKVRPRPLCAARLNVPATKPRHILDDARKLPRTKNTPKPFATLTSC